VNGDPSKDSDHTIDVENMTVDEPDYIFDSVEVNTVSEENDVHGLCSQETSVQIDRENSNVDEPNIHNSSNTNDANAEQTNSIVDDDVEKNDVSQDIIQGLQNKTVSNDVGMEKADEMGCSSVILGEQNIVHDRETFIQDQLTTVDFNNDEDQTSKSKEVKWNDESDCGYGDSSEVENEFSDSSVKPSAKHIKKNQTRSTKMFWLKMMMIEVRVVSLTTVVSLKYLQSNHKVNLNYNSSVDYLH
jgi:hypothetical protein